MQDGITAKLADDLYCGADSTEALLDNWHRVLQALQKRNLHLSPSKTIICPLSTTILGWIWTEGRLSASPHRIATLSSCPPPDTVRGLRSFIGAYKVLGRVLPKCSHVIAPLESAIAGQQSGERIQWTDSLREQFRYAQTHLNTRKAITLPRPSDQLWIVTDGSVTKHGIGATLYITRNEKLHLAAFFSAKLRKHQISWLPCEIEALKTRPQAPTSLETLNYATNTIKIPDGDIEVHNYTIPTNGNHAENSHANFKMNEETREALTIKEKTKRTEPSFEDQRNEYIRSHEQTQKGKIKSKSRNTKLSFGEQQREYICKHKREFIEKNSIERNKETNRQNSGMQNFLEVRKFRRMKQSQTKRNLRKKVIEDQEKSWREYLNLVRQVTTNTTSTTSQYVGKRQLETVTSPLIPSNTRDIHPHVHSQRLIKNQFPFQPTMYPPPLMLVPTKPPIWRQ